MTGISNPALSGYRTGKWLTDWFSSARDSIRNVQSTLDGISGPSFDLQQDANGNWYSTGASRAGAAALFPFLSGIIGVGDDIPPNSGDDIPPYTPQQIVYFDAPYAEKYGMSAETAYQEALANTAYQRKVLDLKAAGLNPVLGINGSGASSFGGSFASYGSAASSGSGKDTSAFEWTDALPYAGAALGLIFGFKNKMKPANMSNAANVGYNIGKAFEALSD